jgi:membrane associated rhomboid family serine protease
MRYRGYSENLVLIWIIVILNLLVFIATIVVPQLINILGLQKAAFLTNPWTIVTNLFVHAGLWHILANMVTFYFFGRFLISLIGAKNMLIIYFVGGIVGNLFFLLLGPQYAVAVGASGAVFALGGTLTVLTPKLKVIVFPIPAPIPLWAAIIGGFVILSLISIVPGIAIAWQAHLGGLLLGLLAGYYFRKRIRLPFF